MNHEDSKVSTDRASSLWWFSSCAEISKRLNNSAIFHLILILGVHIVGALLFYYKLEKNKSVLVIEWVTSLILITKMATTQRRLMRDSQNQLVNNLKKSNLYVDSHKPQHRKVQYFFEQQSSITTLVSLQALVLVAISIVVNAIMATPNPANIDTVAIIATLPFTLLISGTIPFYVETRKVIHEQAQLTQEKLQSLKHALTEFERDSEPIWQYLKNSVSKEWAILFQQWLYEAEIASKNDKGSTAKLRDVLTQELAIYASSFDKQVQLVGLKPIRPDSLPLVNALDKKALLRLLAASGIKDRSTSFKNSNSQKVEFDPLHIDEDQLEGILRNHKLKESGNDTDEDLISQRLETWLTSHSLCRVEATADSKTYPIHKHLRILLSIDGEEKYTRSNNGFSPWLFPSDENAHWVVLNRLRRNPSSIKRLANNPSELITFRALTEVIQSGITRHSRPLREKQIKLAESCQHLNLDFHSFSEDAELFADLFDRFSDSEFMKSAKKDTDTKWSDISQHDKVVVRCLVYALAYYFASNPEDVHTPRRFQSEIKEIRAQASKRTRTEMKLSCTSIPKGHAAYSLREIWTEVREEIDSQLNSPLEVPECTMLNTPLIALEMTHHKGPLQNWIRASNAVHRRFTAVKLIGQIERLQQEIGLGQVLALPLKISNETIVHLLESACEMPHPSQDTSQVPIRLSVASLATMNDNSLESLFQITSEVQ